MLFTLSPVAVEDGYGEAILPLADAKAHLRVEDDSEDDLIGALRDASIDMVQQFTSVRLKETAGIVATFDGFCSRMRMGVGPASTVNVTGVSYIDSVGATIVLDDDWQTGVGGALLPAAGGFWPATGGKVVVTFTAGYPDGSCPPALVAAVRLMLGHLYVNREAVVSGTVGEMPLGVTTLCNLYRMYG